MYKPQEIEKQILEFWEKHKIYEKVKKRNMKGRKFYFLQGPPYTSGKIHIGHAWNNSLKDMVIRYLRMSGFNVWDRAGYDMHGLPSENAVQKKLELKTKDEIISFGVDKFVKECMNFSKEYAGYMSEDLWKLGIWMDYKNAYMPITKDFISGEWAFFKEAWKQNRLYRGSKVMHWDAQSETSLAKHELEYEKVRDTSVFLKFKKKKSKNEYFIIWTTTPWTIPYNLAIIANPNVEYAKIRVDDEYWIMASHLVEAFMSNVVKKKYSLVEKFLGRKLEGQEYEHFFFPELKDAYEKLKKKYPKAHSIILNEKYVDTSSGSGLVHCAPGCGPEDYEAAEAYGIGPFNTLNERGIIENLGPFTGMAAKEDDKKFIKKFEEKSALIAKTIVEHEYPHSWRSHKPVVFRMTEQWFLKTYDLVEGLIKRDKEIKWIPEKARKSYLEWTNNLKDNGITRQRFWGCPVPIWVNEKDKDDFIVISGAEELEKLTGKKFGDLDLHRPWIDKIIIEKNGRKYKRIEDVADVWIDSGVASWNCLYNNPGLIKEYYPADLVLEATEMTRQWFSMLQICAAIMYGKTSFKSVYAHGMILDYQGTKMSKSLGNVISPYEVIDKYSVDVLRYYMCQVNAGENINFNWEDIKTKQRNLIILDNIANFILDIEEQKPKKGSPGIEEKLIISKYNLMLERVTSLFKEFRLDETITEIENFFIFLSKDYIKFIREKAAENSAVLKTLKEVYSGTLQVFSTVCPFICDHLWRKIGGKEKSVHLTNWPKTDKKKIDKGLEKKFENAMNIIEIGLSERDKAKIGLRWPLAKAFVTTNSKFSKEMQEIIMRQINVKKIEFKNGKEIKVGLDLQITAELEAEGFSRELARKIQAERKNAGLKKGDLIELKISCSPDLQIMFKKNLEFLKERTNSKKIAFTDEKSLRKEIVFTIKEKKMSASLV